MGLVGGLAGEFGGRDFLLRTTISKELRLGGLEGSTSRFLSFLICFLLFRYSLSGESTREHGQVVWKFVHAWHAAWSGGYMG